MMVTKKKDRTTITWEPYEINPQVFKSDDPRGLISFIKRLVGDYRGPSGPNSWVINQEHTTALNVARDLLPLPDALINDITTILDLLEINDSIKMWAKY